MSQNHKRRLSAAVFFCLGGWVCNDLANAANSAIPVDFRVFAAAAEEGDAPKSDLFDSGKPAVTPAPAEKPVGSSDDIPDGQTVKAGAFGEIDLHVKDLDVSTVLQLLSIQSKRNIIATKEVAGSVTADLYGVDFYDALDAILHANGFGYREKGKFIYVYTAKELAEIQKQEEKPVTRIIRLNYINSKDASTFVTPLLSGSGSIALSGAVPTGLAPTVSDNGSNSSAHQDTLVIRDLQGNVDQILTIIKELDIRPKQVSIKATVLQARLSEANAFGVDITVLGGSSVDDFTTPLDAIDELADGSVIPTKRTVVGSSQPGNTRTGASNFKLGFVAGSVEAFVRALDEVTDTTIVANPEVLVLNRQRADLLVGGRLGYISTQQTESSTTQTVEFLDIGTQLTVRPFVSDDGMVRLELRPSISTGTTELAGGFIIPVTQEQTMTTNVMVRSGQTVVIGGLFQETTQVTRSQVPGLGDVPIVGNAFKGVDDETDRTEVIFMITPTIVKDELLYAQGDRAMESVDLASFGAREGLLPWSRTKQTSSYMQDALKYYKEGKNDLALMEANKALNLDSTIIDARRMKSAITGQRVGGHNRSILRETTNHVIDGKIGTTPTAGNSVDASTPASPESDNTAAPLPNGKKQWWHDENAPAAEKPAATPAEPAAPVTPAVNEFEPVVKPVKDATETTPEVAPEVTPEPAPATEEAPAPEAAPAEEPAPAAEEAAPAPATEGEAKNSNSSDNSGQDEDARKAIEALNKLIEEQKKNSK